MAKDPKALAFLLEKSKPEAEEAPAEDETGGGFVAAADGIISAIEEGNRTALADELRNFFELCQTSTPKE